MHAPNELDRTDRMADRIAHFDWASTPLGPREQWPSSLCTAVELMLELPQPGYIAWGPDLTALYNDACVAVLGSKHPDALGRPHRAIWPELVDFYADAIRDVLAGEAQLFVDEPMQLADRDTLSWFTFSWLPLRDDAGAIAGFFVAGIDTTEKVRAEQLLQESEARASLLVGALAQATWETDADGLVTTDSPSWRAYTGQGLEEWLGWGWLDAIHPDDRENAGRLWAEAVASQSRVDAEFRLRHAEGGWRWTNVRAVPLLGANGEVRKWLGMNVDIDARKRAEDALRENEGRLAALFDVLPVGVGVAGHDGHYVMLNPAMRRFLPTGMLPSRDPERQWRWRGWADDGTRLTASQFPSARAFRGERVVPGQEMLYVDDDGREMWTRVSAVPLRDAANRVSGVVNMVHDIDAIKRGTEAQRLNEARQKFLLRLGDALRPLDDAIEIRATATRILGEYLGDARVQYWEAEGDGEHVATEGGYARGLPGISARVRVDDYGPHIRGALASARTLVVPDVATDPDVDADALAAYDALQVRAQIAVPLVKRGRLVAVLAVHRSATHAWTPDEVALSEETAERTWSAVERAYAEAALRESEEQLAAELAKAKALQYASSLLISDGESTKLYEHILDTAIEIMGAELGSIQLMDAACSELHLIAYRGFHADAAAYWQKVSVATGSTCGAALSHGGRVIIENVERNEATRASDNMTYWKKSGIVAVQSTPLVARDGSIIGMLSTHWRRPHVPQDAELRLFDVLARQAADFIERNRAQAEVKESDDKYRSLFDSIDEGYCVIEVVLDESGKAIDLIPREVNRAWKEKTGLPDAIGRRMSELMPNLEGHWLDYYESVIRTAKARRKENYLRDVDRWFTAHYSLVGGLGSNMVAVVFDDITSRKRAEVTLRESAERQTFLLKLSDAVRPLVAPADIQGETTRLLREQLDAGWCYYVDWDLHRTSGRVLRDSTREGLASLAGAHGVSDASGFLELLARGDVLTVGDYAGYEQLPADIREKFVALGFRSMMAAPLVKHGRLIATLIVGDNKVRDWSASEASLLVDVAERTWAAVERAHAETALRKSEEKYRSLFETMGQGYAEIEVIRDPDGRPIDVRYLELNPQYERMTGIPVAKALGHTVLEMMPNYDDWWIQEWGRIADSGCPAHIENKLVATGEWYEASIYPRGGNRLSVLYEEVTVRRKAEAALAESERRLRTLIEGIPQLVWRSADNGMWTWSSPQWQHCTGQSEAESCGLGWLGAVHPDDRAATIQAWHIASEEGRLDIEHRIRRAGDGTYLWHHTRSVPVRDDGGRIVEWLGTTTEVQELKELQQRQQVLVSELQHRTFNLMGVMRAMSDATYRSSASLDEYHTMFDDRIAALGRVQRLLSRRGEDERVTFEELIRGELEAVGALHRGGDISLDGPPGVALRSSTVQTFAMALHELTTNAVKYGALKQPGAQLAVRWHVEPREGERPLLHVDWRETGVAMPPRDAAPQGTGQGRRLIEQALPYQLRAKTSYRLESDGVHCTIALPVSKKTSADALRGHAHV